MDGSSADFASHIEGSHADFAPHMERRISFRDKKMAKIAISANKKNIFFQTTYILGVYMTYVTTFGNTNILRESTFKAACLIIIATNQSNVVSLLLWLLGSNRGLNNFRTQEGPA